MVGNLTYFRISIGLVILTCSILVGLDLAGVLPRRTTGLAETRMQLCQSLAMEAVAAADRKDFAAVRRYSAIDELKYSRSSDHGTI